MFHAIQVFYAYAESGSHIGLDALIFIDAVLRDDKHYNRFLRDINKPCPATRVCDRSAHLHISCQDQHAQHALVG